MPTSINGRRLGVAENGVFTFSNTDSIEGGRLWPAAALTWNAMQAAYAEDGHNPRTFVPGGPASSARSIQQQRQLKAEWTAKGQPGKAATPGTSNHGWGIAVDIPNDTAQAWLRRNAARFGWSNAEGQRVGENWHWGYVGASQALLNSLREPYAGYTASEKRWITEYDRLLAAKRKGNDTVRARARRVVLRAYMTRQRRRLYTIIHKRGGATQLRKKRYASLLARTKGDK